MVSVSPGDEFRDFGTAPVALHGSSYSSKHSGSGNSLKPILGPTSGLEALG